MIEFQVLKQLQDSPGSLDKLAILRQNDSPRLRQIMLLTYNRFWTYRVKQIDRPATYNSVQPDVFDELVTLLNLLAEHTTGANESKALIKRLLAKCTEEGALWVERIITRDLKCGISESTLNKAYPGLVPVFNVQLAYPIYKKGKTPKNFWPTLEYPVIVEEKLDGVRCVAIVKDGKVNFYSREGLPYDDRGVFAADILKLRPGTDFVLDGEVIAHRFMPDHKTAIKYREGNWPFELGKSLFTSDSATAAAIKAHCGFYVWDVIEYPFFSTQGVEGSAVPVEQRKMHLFSLFERNPGIFNNLFYVPNAIAHNEAEVKSMFTQMRVKDDNTYAATNAKGAKVTYKIPVKEGIMLKRMGRPYGFGRNDSVLKVKKFYNADMRIVGAYEGKPDTQFVGMLGGVNLASDDGVYATSCGSGFDPAQRFEMWMAHKRGELVGLIGEISFQEITTDGSFRFPVWQGFRPDKTTTNVEDGAPLSGPGEEYC